MGLWVSSVSYSYKRKNAYESPWIEVRSFNLHLNHTTLSEFRREHTGIWQTINR